MKSNKIAIIALLFSSFAFSQADLGSWNILNFNLKLNPKWNVFMETQLRSLSFYDQFHYYEYKTGATYKIKNTVSVTTGIGSYNTYSEGGNFENPIQNKEIRTWLQLSMKNDLDFVVLEHRYRAEQRFTSNGYRNRFRYRIGAIVPINNKQIVPKTFYVSAWNEIFFTDLEPYFERNRMFVGLGYEFSKQLAVQTGYIHQFDYKIIDETGRDFLNIALMYTFDLSNKNEFTPIIQD
jgi:hypothetical protein